MRLTLRRSMSSLRAMARWLWPARYRARTVCSRAGATGSSSGASCASGGAAWYRSSGTAWSDRALRPVRTGVISSSNEPTSTSAGHALTARRPDREWATDRLLRRSCGADGHQPCAVGQRGRGERGGRDPADPADRQRELGSSRRCHQVQGTSGLRRRRMTMASSARTSWEGDR